MGDLWCEIASILQVLAGDEADKWFTDDSQMELAIGVAIGADDGTLKIVTLLCDSR